MTSAKLFALLSEFIMFLLGSMIFLLAWSGRMGRPARPLALVLLGIVLMYWGVRTWSRKKLQIARTLTLLQALSLASAGIFVLLIGLTPVAYTQLLLMLTGGILVIRGITGGIVLATAKEEHRSIAS